MEDDSLYTVLVTRTDREGNKTVMLNRENLPAREFSYEQTRDIQSLFQSGEWGPSGWCSYGEVISFTITRKFSPPMLLGTSAVESDDYLLP
jgi:hypothetical protein